MDIALRQFLNLLLWLRQVLLQDRAILHSRHPHSPIFAFYPFNTPAFHEFSACSIAAIDQAAETAHIVFEHLPSEITRTFHGTYTNIQLEQQLEWEENMCQ